MMRRSFWAVGSLPIVLLLAGVSVVGQANPYSPRQYYGGIQKHPRANYSYRPYYYKPSPTYAGYRHHYAIYVPSQPKHVYFYNPYKKVYWGRCPINTGGQPQYSLLAEKDRKGNLEEIPESAFPAPGEPPPVPESTDGAKLELPPDDLPGEITLPRST
jgi:hypothetical protein